MKNQSNKSNKTRFIARVLLLILLLTSALSLAACEMYDMEYNFVLNDRPLASGYYPPGHFIATSNTTIFEKNDITFNIAYATHQIQEKDPRSNYYSYGYEGNMYFGLYIFPEAKTQEEYDFIKNETYDDINAMQNIHGHTFINGIRDEEAFTDEYALIPTPLFISDGSIYNHTEEITIPTEYVTEQYGTFYLRFVCFTYYQRTNKFEFRFMREIEFDYREIDEKTIEIKFNKKTFMDDEL